MKDCKSSERCRPKTYQFQLKLCKFSSSILWFLSYHLPVLSPKFLGYILIIWQSVTRFKILLVLWGLRQPSLCSVYYPTLCNPYLYLSQVTVVRVGFRYDISDPEKPVTSFVFITYDSYLKAFCLYVANSVEWSEYFDSLIWLLHVLHWIESSHTLLQLLLHISI